MKKHVEFFGREDLISQKFLDFHVSCGMFFGTKS